MAGPKRKRSEVSNAEKATKRIRSTDDDVESEKPFRFLDLPAELRNNVYSKVLETDTSIRLSRSTAKITRGLITTSALAGVNKQVSGEFIDYAIASAPKIQTTVRQFNFSHIVTFLNRLADHELHNLLPKTAAPAERRILIDLVFDRSYVHGTPWLDKKKIDRWLNRLDHPTKNGAGIDFEYKCSFSGLFFAAPSRQAVKYTTSRSENLRSGKHAKEIVAAIEAREKWSRKMLANGRVVHFN